MTDDPTQDPPVRLSDADREAAVARLERALGEGRITVDEFRQRAESAYAAVRAGELEPLLADLPATPSEVEMVGSRPPDRLVNLMGDIKPDAGAPPPRRAITGMGNIRIDLRDLRTDADVVELDLFTALGNIEVIVSEGVDAVLEGWTVLGKRKVELAAVPRLAGTPRVVVRAQAVLGDVRLRSLAPGESASRWHALLDRLAQRPQPPAAGPAG
jgi:hypothetical protein